MDTILFDLDGTLLPLDQDRFVAIYFREMGAMFHDLIDPRLLVKHVWTATGVMVGNTEPRSNQDVFMEHFSGLINGDLAVYQERFDRFYDQGFLKTQEAVAESPEMKKSVALLKAKGYQLVIATNPIFPQKAIGHRIRWAGFEPSDFTYVTAYETNNYCKPQLHFYREMLDKIGKQPADCLMVGNDVQEDLVASELGIATYLITDHLIQRSEAPAAPDYQGSYHDFLRFVEELGPAGGLRK